MEESMRIRRVLIIADEDFAGQAPDEAAAAFGLFMRRVPHVDGLDAVAEDFGPDAVILDPAVPGAGAAEVLQAVAGSGAALLLLGGPDDMHLQVLQRAAAEAGMQIDGILAKPLTAEGLEVALRVIVGEMGFSAEDIAGAVMRGEMTAWYQLQLKRSGNGWRASGAEALARWQHPEHGMVMPGAFVPVAEAAGQIALITDCVLQTTVQQLAVWHRQDLPFRVSVNITPSLVNDPEFPDRLSRLVHEYDVPARSLLLEIPEPALAAAPAEFLGMLARLRILGFGLALEHFGGGVSSLADLYRTPFSELKIHRRLIGRLDEDEDAQRLVRGIIQLGDALGLDTCAEAVETAESLDFLYAAGCTHVQGFHISRPLAAAAFQVAARQWL